MSANPPPPKAPLVLLGLMTLATFGGPFAILLVIRGGSRAGWPPDRPVEWWVFGAVVALVVALMAGCLTSGLWARPKVSGEARDSTGGRTPSPQ